MKKILFLFCVFFLTCCSACNVLDGSGNGISSTHKKPVQNSDGLGDIPSHISKEEGNLSIDMDIMPPRKPDLTHGTAVRTDCSSIVEGVKKHIVTDEWTYDTCPCTDENGDRSTTYYWNLGNDPAAYEQAVTVSNLSFYYGNYANHTTQKVCFSFRNDPMFSYSEDPHVYNAYMYETDTDLPFMSRDKALKQAEATLKQWGVPLEALDCKKTYVMSHELMQEQIYDVDVATGEEVSFDFTWDDRDDCYYFFARDTFQGEPVYYYDPVWENTSTPIKILYNSSGICEVSGVRTFRYTADDAPVKWCSFDSVLQTITSKYDNLLGDTSQYEIKDCEFRYYLKKKDSTNYEAVPVWAFEVTTDYDSEAGSHIRETEDVLIDAETAMEVVVE